ncbi:DEAD/DEAH box helicase, partial [candidate division WOR-3 bacterium]|nr:DEAD/DEAH box helicase [candidate division WOR-3 bacterium]
MRELLERFSRSPILPAIAESLSSGAHTGVSGVVGSARALLAASIAQRLGRAVILITDDVPTARALHLDLSAWVQSPSGDSPLGLVFFEPDSPRLPVELAGLGPGPAVIVASAESLHKPAPIWESANDECQTPNVGNGPLALVLSQQLALEKLVGWLEENGYERTDLVTEPGEYATRGGIADVFAEGAESPVRVEFLGDTIASLRRFDPLLQRSVSHIESASLPTRKSPTLSDQPASTLLPRDLIVVTEGTEIEARAVLLLCTEPDAEFDLGCRPAHSYLGNIELLRSEIAGRQPPNAECRFSWYVAASTQSQRERLSSIIGDGPHYFTGTLSSGFIAESLGFGLLTEREIYGTPVFHPPRRRFKGLPIDNIVSLRPGDYVVHIDYGIGSFEGMRRMTNAGVEKDYIVVRYAGNDKVYVPVENIGLLDRYIGSEDKVPALDRLGGRSWLHAKAKAARASAEYAEELLEIYARRATARGIQFERDTQWQTELEASFPYEETPDQLKVMAEVKRDMQSPRPMDRLICGDVGYGKTEIALRAAFKAASNLKQVAVLAPTTILCYQHYATFRKRLARFPFRVEMLSRLVPPAEQHEILAGLKSGVVDIVVGTHQLLNPGVAYHDLGLLIIDEEQKFGV